MTTAITDGILVSVQTEFLPKHSNPEGGHFAFAYRIRIENRTDHTVQLLRRSWHIHDAHLNHHQVEGIGVVGLQPVIEPGQYHEYVSGCHLKTAVGKMAGTYQMKRLFDGRLFTVKIPDFTLIVPHLLN